MQEYVGNARIMHAILDDKARHLKDKVFAWYDKSALTYADLSDQSARIASALVDRFQTSRAENVAVLLPNCLEYLSIQFGISKAGAVMVPVNALARKNLLAHFLNNSDTRCLFVDASLYPNVMEIEDRIGKVESLIWVGADCPKSNERFRIVPYDELLAAPGRELSVEVSWTDPVDIFYTSGTTGVSKGVVLPHNHHYTFGMTIARAGRLGPNDVIYIMLPLYHGAGSYMSIMPALLCEGSIFIADGFSARTFLEDIRRAKATAVWAVNSIAPILLKQPERPDDADNPLQVYYYIGMPPGMVEQFERRFGLKAIDTYGATEAGHLAYTLWDERRLGSVGPVNTEHYDVRIVDENDAEVPIGEIGECVSRNKQPYTQMTGYYKMPEETLAVMGNRWLHSGDLCRMDKDGWLYFVGRGKDMIRRRGENISCYELESMLSSHAGILECASIAVPSDIGEDEIKVVVAPKPNHDLSFENLTEFCDRTLPKYMMPRYIEFVSAVPKLANQKIDKIALKENGLNPATWDVIARRYVGAN